MVEVYWLQVVAVMRNDMKLGRPEVLTRARISELLPGDVGVRFAVVESPIPIMIRATTQRSALAFRVPLHATVLIVRAPDHNRICLGVFDCRWDAEEH